LKSFRNASSYFTTDPDDNEENYESESGDGFNDEDLTEFCMTKFVIIELGELKSEL
jgi:hypothetical protein